MAARSDSDWYVVVMAVVAVGPLAIGVRYSVWVWRSVSPDGGTTGFFGLGIQGPWCALA